MSRPDEQARTALRLEEVAKRAGVSRAHVYRAVHAGELKAVVMSRGKRPVWRITLQAEAEWLASLPTTH